jgi:hypothetical protein
MNIPFSRIGVKLLAFPGIPFKALFIGSLPKTLQVLELRLETQETTVRDGIFWTLGEDCTNPKLRMALMKESSTSILLEYMSRRAICSNTLNCTQIEP